MGITKVMIIRHAEKPGLYPETNPPKGLQYNGINPFGAADPESLVTMGWERAGGIANLFFPNSGTFQSNELVSPDYIYAANPASKTKTKTNGNTEQKEPSQRPYQTISALYGKLQSQNKTVNLNDSFEAKDFAKMVTAILALNTSGTVLIAWQHQDILLNPKKNTTSILNELISQTQTNPANLGNPLPQQPWPGDRYDMVLVLDRPSGSGVFTAFTQVPQMLLAGDSTTLFS